MLDAEQGIEKSEIIVNVKIKLAYPSPYPSPTRGEGTHFISPPLRGGDEGGVNYVNLFKSFTIVGEE